jgi:hypothetical protein
MARVPALPPPLVARPQRTVADLPWHAALVKRQMYGRGNLDLLRVRVLRVAW